VPELPETETIARDLDGALRGAVIRSVQVLRPDVLRTATGGGRALPGAAASRAAHAFARKLASQSIAHVHRRAKSIVLALASDDAIVVTPRFTGALLLSEARTATAPAPAPREAAADRTHTAPDAYDCLALSFADARTLRYRDIRRLGTVTLLSPRDLAAWDAAVGPEPLDPDLTPERFSGIIRGSNRAVKSILMDQRRLAGVGNIYANEACWRAGIRPTRRGRVVTRAQASDLLTALRAVLSASIARRGTTFRDFRDAYGARGGFAPKLEVYGRGGLPCRSCGARLRESHAIEGRSTVWCAQCQR